MSTLLPIPELSYPLVVETVGALLLGNLLAAALWGVTCAQAWHYYQSFPNDSRFLKWLVFVLLALDTVHQGLITHTVWIYAVSNYANPLELRNAIWSFTFQVFPETVTAFSVESFFIYRIYILSGKKWWLVVPFVATNLTAAGLSIVYTFRVTPIKTVAGIPSVWRRILGAGGATAFVNDMSIALVLCYFLYSRRTDRNSMTIVLNWLIFYALGTGLATSIFTFAAGVVFLVAPNTFIYGSIGFVAAKLHINSLLISFNSRRTVQRQLHGAAVTLGVPASSFPSGGIRVDQSTTHRTDLPVDGLSNFKAQEATYSTTGVVYENIEMDKREAHL